MVDVRGEICPACGRALGIVKVTRTEPYGAGDVAIAAMFQWLGFLFVVFGRTTTRLRCSACRRVFRQRMTAFQAAAWWCLVLVAGTTLTYVGTAAWRSSQPDSETSGIESRLGSVFTRMAKEPLESAAALAFVALMVVVTLLWMQGRARARRMEEWEKKVQREKEEQALAEHAPLPAQS